MKIKRITAAAAAFLLLASCGAEPAGVPKDGTESVTEEITAAPAPAEVVLVRDGKTDFAIIRPDNATAAVVADAVALKKKITKRFDVGFEIGNDFLMPGQDGSAKCEILVGSCARRESEEFIASLGDGGYGFRVSGNKIVIAGKNDNLLALALNAFENQILFDRSLEKDGAVILADGLEQTYRSSSVGTGVNAPLASAGTVIAVKGDAVCHVPVKDKYKSGQGAASDGTWFYSSLTCKNADGSQTGIIVKSPMDSDDRSLKQYSEDLPLDHANDMCYNPKENTLVITNMKGKILTVVDADTLQMVKQVDATWLGGTPWAISYNASRDCYVIAAGGYLNILGSDFHSVAPGIPMGGGPSGYTGQGMDCDDDYLYMPLSPGETGKDNVIVVYSWTDGYVRTVHMDETAESESMINVNGEYFIVFNSSGCSINRLNYCLLYE